MKLRLIILLSLFLLLTVSIVQAQDADPTAVPEATETPEEDDDAPLDCDHPRVIYLAEKTAADCQTILDLHASGVGFGQILKAAVIADGIEGDWQALLAAHLDGTGWGHLGQAYGLQKRFADVDATPEELMALKDSGLGWGQIDKIYDLTSLGISAEQAADMLRNGMGWEEIQAELGLEEGGAPPWAGGPKDKDENESGNNGNNGSNGNNGNSGNNSNNGNGQENNNGNNK